MYLPWALRTGGEYGGMQYAYTTFLPNVNIRPIGVAWKVMTVVLLTNLLTFGAFRDNSCFYAVLHV